MSCSKDTNTTDFIKGREIVYDIEHYAKELASNGISELTINPLVSNDNAIIFNSIDELKDFINDREKELNDWKKNASEDNKFIDKRYRGRCPDNHGEYHGSVPLSPWMDFNVSATFEHGKATEFSSYTSVVTLNRIGEYRNKTALERVCLLVGL